MIERLEIGKTYVVEEPIVVKNAGVNIPSGLVMGLNEVEARACTYVYPKVCVKVKGTKEIKFLTLPASVLFSNLSPAERVYPQFEKGCRKILRENPFEMLASIGNGGYTLGSDPEVFVRDGQGELIPAWAFLPAKEKGYMYGNNLLHWDGFQGEFTTNPTACLAYHVDSIYNGLRGILHKAKAFNPTARLSWENVVDIPMSLMEAASSEHVQMGCAPSQNIYETFVPPIVNGRAIPIRFGGCHIHFGHYKPWITERFTQAIRGADHVGAVIATAILEKLERPERREYYGRPGEYRLSKDKKRLEYRTISSAALVHPAITHLIFDVVRQGVAVGEAKMLDTLWQTSDEEMREVILATDVRGARKILAKNRSVVSGMIERIYGDRVENTWLIIQKGAKEFVDIAPDAMEKAWRLDGSREWSFHSEGQDECWKKFSVKLTPAHA